MTYRNITCIRSACKRLQQWLLAWATYAIKRIHLIISDIVIK